MHALLRLLRRLLILALLVAVAIAVAAFDLHRQLGSALDLTEPEHVLIEPGTRLRDAVLQLRDRDRLASIRQGLYLELYGRFSGKAAAIKAGEYRLEPGITAYQLLDLWVSGKTVMYEIRIVEGTRFEAALRQILEHPQLRKTLPPGATGEQVMAALGAPGLHPEGRFFPDTYRFARDTPDITILRKAYAAMEQALRQEWEARAPELPYAAPDEALTMASIIEKETGLASERPQIAGVFVRRLALGMRLQTDPTVIYGLGESFDGNLRRRDLQADGHYNTYLRAGLPPTPICLPGRAALHAALHPAPGKTLFFVSRGDGSHQFSETLEEHQAAVRRYQLRGGS